MISRYELEKEFLESRVKAQELLDNNDEELTEEAREKIKDVIKIIDKMEEKGPVSTTGAFYFLFYNRSYICEAKRILSLVG